MHVKAADSGQMFCKSRLYQSSVILKYPTRKIAYQKKKKKEKKKKDE